MGKRSNKLTLLSKIRKESSIRINDNNQLGFK